MVSLSEQNLLDCDNVNDKCDGGTPWDAFDWVQANGGQEENEKYPYEVLVSTARAYSRPTRSRQGLVFARPLCVVTLRHGRPARRADVLG